ncbi:MAG: hypothetical protein JO131_04350 [Gammaproteobacteria bacterium]|nr:hypothetical protein [Gammaproteobacteria bacterium]
MHSNRPQKIFFGKEFDDEVAGWLAGVVLVGVVEFVIVELEVVDFGTFIVVFTDGPCICIGCITGDDVVVVMGGMPEGDLDVLFVSGEFGIEVVDVSVDLASI